MDTATQATMVAQYEECNLINGDNSDHQYGSVMQNGSSLINSISGKDNEQNNEHEMCTTPPHPPPTNNPLLSDQELLKDELAGMTRLAILVIITYLIILQIVEASISMI